jgi:alpha-1,2-mannosyltransferase
MRPLTGLPLQVAYRVWLQLLVLATASIGVYCAHIYGLMKYSGVKTSAFGSDSLVTSASLIATCIFAFPIQNNILMGQVNLLVLAFLAFGLIAYFNGNPVIAGALIAPAVMIKVTPVLLLLFFSARRSFRTVCSCCAGILGLFAISLVFGDLHSWRDYISILPERGYGKDIPFLFPASAIFNFSPAGHFSRIMPGDSRTVSIFALVTVLVATALATGFSYLAAGKRQEALALALYFPVVLIASPLTYVHHVIFLIPAGAVWLSWAWSESRFFFFGLFVLLAFASGIDWPVFYPLLGKSFSGPALQAINLYVIGALFFFGTAAFLTARKPTRSLYG